MERNKINIWIKIKNIIRINKNLINYLKLIWT